MLEIKLNDAHLTVDVVPDQCPMCHCHVQPTVLSNAGNRIVNAASEVRQVFLRCPRSECQRVFIATYVRPLHTQGGGGYRLLNVEPQYPQQPRVPAEIASLSPSYVQILTQSAAAEAFGLDQVAGCGYRKSLEFLIKDYAISLDPDAAEQIKSQFLGACIESRISDANIKACAKRATWLGNDETHYVRKWEQKDIRDLKQLLKLTEVWIHSHALTQAYIADMQPGEDKAR